MPSNTRSQRGQMQMLDLTARMKARLIPRSERVTTFDGPKSETTRRSAIAAGRSSANRARSSAKRHKDLWRERAFSKSLGMPIEIQMRDDGEPMRNILLGSHAKPVGRYPSVKTGGSHNYESRNERHGFYLAEVDSTVLGYESQHLKLIFGDDGKLSYTADRLDCLADGRMRVVEVKGRYNPACDPDYALKLEMAKSAYEEMGLVFELQEKDEIEAQPRFKTVERIQAYRLTSVTFEDLSAVREIFADCQLVTYGDLQRVFKSAPVGFAKFSAMLVRRIIGANLADGLTDETPLWRIRL